MTALAAGPTRTHTGTALLVDGVDEARLCARADLLARMGAGVQVRVAGDASVALSMVRRGGIDVVVANLEQGDTLLRAVRDLDPDLPIVFVTQWPSEGTGGHELHNMVITAMFGYRLVRRHGRARMGGR
jgi:hypothetical protein